jgi:hypothetical protein
LDLLRRTWSDTTQSSPAAQNTVTAHWDPLTAPRGAVPTTLRTTGLENVESSASHYPIGLHGLLQACSFSATPFGRAAVMGVVRHQ